MLQNCKRYKKRETRIWGYTGGTSNSELWSGKSCEGDEVEEGGGEWWNSGLDGGSAGSFAIEKITELANKIYETGKIPKTKEEGAVECGKHRTISIMSQVAKIILRVIDERLLTIVEETVDRAQFAFRKGKGTRNAIFALRTNIERSIEKKKDLFMCFVDFIKAFHTVRRGFWWRGSERWVWILNT